MKICEFQTSRKVPKSEIRKKLNTRKLPDLQYSYLTLSRLVLLDYAYLIVYFFVKVDNLFVWHGIQLLVYPIVLIHYYIGVLHNIIGLFCQKFKI